MRGLVFITQVADPEDPDLGATAAKIEALAERLDEVVVLALRAVPPSLPANVRVHRFGARTKLGRGLRFEDALARSLRPRPLAVLAHMCPVYAVLAAPLVRPLGVPLLFWYTHWKLHAGVRAAEAVSTRVVSVDARSFPMPSRKLVATGHGIELSRFTCADGRNGGGLRLLALGRFSEAKGLAEIVRGVDEAARRGIDVRLALHGPSTTPDERAYRGRVERLVGELGAKVDVGGPLPRGEVPTLFAETDVLVNNMRAGAPDKVVYEAAASCLPVLASNPVLDDVLDDELRFVRDDPSSLADRVEALAELPAVERGAIGRRLRERVEARHSVDAWADRILEAARA